jgi:RIO kinase 1
MRVMKECPGGGNEISRARDKLSAHHLAIAIFAYYQYPLADMAESTQNAAQAHEPPHRYVENEGYVDLQGQVDRTSKDHIIPGSAHDAEEQEEDDEDDYDDIFDDPQEELMDTDLNSSNPADYTKAYNRQRKLNDNSASDTQRPKTNPQLNTRAAIDDHIKSLSAHTAKLKLNDLEAGLGGGKSHGAEKSDRATSEQVLDPRTRMILLQLLNRNIVSEINGVISTGKEANVYHAVTIPNTSDGAEPLPALNRAIKVYKTSILVFKDRDKYVTGEYRFRGGYNKSSNRALVKVWAEKEFRNLRRLKSAGIPCPDAICLKSHVLVMAFLGSKKGNASPRLRDVEFLTDAETRWKETYVTLLSYMRRLYQICRLVHADLSEYNLLWHEKEERLYMIDVSQSVEHDHPRSLEFLRMDIKNVSDFFRRKGVEVLSERKLFNFITASSGSVEFSEMEVAVQQLLVAKAEGGDDDEDEEQDEVWRQQYIPQNLQQVYDIERDGERIRDGDAQDLVYQDLLAGKSTGVAEGALQSAETKGDSEAAEDNSDSADSDDSDEEEKDPFAPKQPRGKKHEDKDAKRDHKKAVKEEKREKRKEKLPKHLKKKLVGQGSRGKK